MDWTEVNERRIKEKTQELMIYCAQKRCDMTARGFELARISLDRLLDNIVARNSGYSSIPETVRRSMEHQDICVAECSENQAASLARTIVYKCIGDDLDLYPVSASKKLLRSKARGYEILDIPKDEMTVRDRFFVMYSIVSGEQFSRSMQMELTTWFRDLGLDVYQAQVYSVIFHLERPVSIKALPRQSQFRTDYRKAAKTLVEKGLLREKCRMTYTNLQINL